MIHYHGTKFSGGDESHLALRRRHAFVSFIASSRAYAELVATLTQSFALDNGAFSAWTAGTPLDIDGFMKWAAHWMRHPGCDWAVIPDVIDGDEAANDALLTLVPTGSASWVPVWHLHESLDRLERLVNEWPRVALGSSGQYAEVGDPSWWGRMADAMSVACDDDGYPLCKLHGLRMLAPTVFSHIPLASADSTNVGRNIGIDGRWTGPHAPKRPQTRALVMMEDIELHPCASRWSGTSGYSNNLELAI